MIFRSIYLSILSKFSVKEIKFLISRHGYSISRVKSDIFVSIPIDFSFENTIKFKIEKATDDGSISYVVSYNDFSIKLNSIFELNQHKIRQEVLSYYKELFPSEPKVIEILDVDLYSNKVTKFEFGILEDTHKTYNIYSNLPTVSYRTIENEFTKCIGYVVKNNFSNVDDDDIVVIKNRLHVDYPYLNLMIKKNFPFNEAYIFINFESYSEIFEKIQYKK